MKNPCTRCGADLEPDGLCPACAYAALDAAAPTKIADKFVHQFRGLKDVRLLGRGGMGIVYRARQTHLERDVAVKVVSDQFTADPDFQKRFEQEAKVLAALDHPNIVRVHEFGIEGNLRYFVMEYVEGEPLRRAIDRGDLGPERAMRIVLSLAEALDYAHQRGVIHRDIKPENVLLRSDGAVKLVDFGIARPAASTRLTESGAIVGTPRYMAPEQREGKADHRADIYSLGILAGELTDRLPEIVARATAPNPADRYASAAEMASAIREIVEPADERVAPRIPFRTRVARLAGSRLFWILATGALFEVLYFGSRLSAELPPDPQAEFNRLTHTDWTEYREAIERLRDPRIEAEVNALLAREASGRDFKRAQIAIQVARASGRLQGIPPDAQVRVGLRWQEDTFSFERAGLGFPIERAPMILSAAEQCDQGTIEEVATDLLEGRIAFEDMPLAALVVARRSNAATVRRLHAFLLSAPAGSPWWAALLAFAARVDLPVPRLDPVKPELREIYLRHLPGILDRDEAVWEKAVALAREIEKWAGTDGERYFSTDVAQWEAALGERPSEEEAKARPYAAAVAKRWKKTGRQTLPYHPEPHADSMLLSRIQRGRTEAHARALGDTPEAASWKVVAIHVGTIAGEPQLIGSTSGSGPVKFEATLDVDDPHPAAIVHVGLTSMTPPRKRKLGTARVEVAGEIGSDGFDGTVSQSLGGGSGRSSGTTPVIRGAATVLKGMRFGQNDEYRHGTIVLLLVETQDEWRVAVAKGLERQEEPRELLELAAWIPVPEARAALTALWERREGLHPESAVHLSCALLMIGESAPLSEPDRLKGLDADLAMRVYLFSPNASARRAVEPRVGLPSTPLDGERIAERLRERGEIASAVLASADSAVAGRKLSSEPWILIACGVAVLVWGWLVRDGFRRRGAIAYGLIFTGLVFRFLTVEAGGRLWFPAVGDLLLLLAAFLYGGWALRGIAFSLTITGTLQLMMPSSPPLFFASLLLIALYVGALALDLLMRWLPAGMRGSETLAFLATAWVLVIPSGFAFAAALLLSLTRGEFAFTLFSLSGGWGYLYMALMIWSPLWLARRQRVRLACA